MSGGQRAFAQKLSKKGAAEVRKQVSSAYLNDLPKSISGINLAAGHNVPLTDVVEPPDFEDFLLQHQNAVDRDPIRQLLEFPNDDVSVQVLRRQARTTTPIVPELGADSDPHVRDCIKCYTNDYTVVERRYEKCSNEHWLCEDRDLTLKSTPRQEYEVDVEETPDANQPDKSPLSSQQAQRGSVQMPDTPRGSWASSIFDLTQADPLLPKLLEREHQDETDVRNDYVRQQNRHEAIFSLYPQQNEEDIIEHRQPAELPEEHFGHRILVKCLGLKLELEIEPIFASMALYDVKERKKISENFYFDLSPESIKKMIGGHIPFQDISTLSRSCAFSLSNLTTDVFLVVKLEKVLQQGDITDVAEPYMKDDKNRDKVRQNAAYFCDRLGKYRMPFAWTAVDLMNIINGVNNIRSDQQQQRSDSLDRRTSSSLLNQYESFRRPASFIRHGSLERPKSNSLDSRSSVEDFGANIENFKPVTITVSSFFKHESDKLSDDDLFKFLQDLKRASSVLKRLKTIPGQLKLDIQPYPEDIKYCLTPELYRIDPYPDDKTRPTKEVVEFPSKEVHEPNVVYRNLLFVYPKSLNFTSRQGSARNIAVKVQLMCGEEEHHALPVIFGKSSCPEYAKEAYTAVSYHNKNPIFYDEMKLRLPARLSDSHHLLFSMYHISCQKKTDMTPIETPIGYTWLPLLRDGRLCVGDVSLPVSLEKPPANYSVLHPDVQLPGMKWVDNHKGLFNITINALSTIHTLDEHLDRFLSLVHAAEENKIPPRIGETNFEKEMIRSINDLVHATGGPLVRFLTLILDKLLQLMVKPPIIAGQLANVGQTCFEAIAQIVRRVGDLVEEKNDQHSRSSLLTGYIQYSGTLPHPDNSATPTNSPSYIRQESALADRRRAHRLTALSLQEYSEQILGEHSPTGPGNYSTLGRPISLNVSHHGGSHHRSNSDPDLPSSNPGSPDAEVASIVGGKNVDRSGSFRSHQQPDVMQGAGMYMGKSLNKKLVHEELAIQWVVSSGSTRDLAFGNAWFLFELMVKAMGEYLARTGRDQLHRQQRFSSQFMEDVTQLVQNIIRDIIEKYTKDFSVTRGLNASLAFFLQDCFALMDRGFVFQLVKKYCKVISSRISQLTDGTSLVILKLDFLRIVCAHEHYVALNLPFGTPLTPSAPSSPSPSVASSTSQTSSTCTLMERGVFTELSNDYRAQHFLTGLVLAELATVLESNNVSLQQRAISVVRNLLSSHDADPRHRDPNVRARVATLYLPIIGIVIDALPQLYDPNVEGRGGRPGQRDLAGIDQDVAMAIATSAVFGGSGGGGGGGEASGRDYDPMTRARRSQLSPEWTRHLLSCFLWVVKSVERRILHSWWADLPVQTLSQILEVLYFATANFEYKVVMDPTTPKVEPQGKKAMRQYSQQTIKKSVDMKSRLEDAILGSVSARSELMARRSRQQQPVTPQHHSRANSEEPTTPTPESPPTEMMPFTPRLRWRKDMTTWRQSADHTDSRARVDVEADAHLEGNLSSEVSMVVLDTLEMVVQIVQQADTLQTLLAYVLRVLLHCLAVNQSAAVLTHMFATQRSIVSKFPELLFEEETEQCADLCLRLLRHCSSPISNTRTHASASLYLLMRHNFEIGNNFARVKMQVTMSLSSLVGQNQNFNEEYLRKSLKTILTYAESDEELQETTFPEQVRDLVFNLHMILSDTVKMKAFQEDPEMLLDLMYRIAKGYQTSPDLRLTWLQNMAAKHSERHNHAEAAQCLIHSAGLVAEYLNMLEDRPHLPIGCVAFQHISQNVLEESAVSDDVVSPDEEGICTGKYFSESGLVGLLEQAASSFTMAGMYEAVNYVYRVLIPIYEASKDFKKLASVHEKLRDAFSNIISLEGKRVFGTYFRVGFYGSRFGDLDGEEFIYKEPAITKLAEISHRLENFYSEKFGREEVRMIKDSNAVEPSKLDPEKAYVQITYVEPYFDLYEQAERQTFFDKHYNIRRFMYATPFTLDGRAHGDLPDQYKKKTIVTTSQAFPYVKTRLSVTNREQIELTPIEVAIEDIQKKTTELYIALRQEPPDPKMLQMVLQGCIGTTVNQGPVEIATVFLRPLHSPELPAIIPNKHHNKLRIAFKDLLKKCSDALARNKTLIGPDQREYQRELERNYLSVKDRLLPLISSERALQEAAAAAQTGTVKKKHKHRDRHSDGHGRRPKSYA